MKPFKPLFVMFLAGVCLSGISQKAFAKCTPSGNDICGVRMVAVNKTTASVDTASFVLSAPWPGHTFKNIAAGCLQRANINSPTGQPIPAPTSVTIIFCDGKNCATCTPGTFRPDTAYPITATLTKIPTNSSCQNCCQYTQ